MDKEELLEKIAYLEDLSKRNYRNKSIMENAKRKLRTLKAIFEAYYETYNN
jgi:hypothetical protein